MTQSICVLLPQLRGALDGHMADWASFNLSLVNDPEDRRPWSGNVHLVAFYARALDATEVRTNYRAGPDPVQ